MERNLIYLVNPISGTKDKEGLLQLIQRKTNEKNIPFQVLQTRQDGRYEFLKEKIKEEKITDIIVCGGDGSINQVAGTLINIDINIGIIPMGSGNGLALTAGIPRNAKKALDIILRGKASFIDGFYINEAFSCMLCGLGFDAKVAHQFAEHPSRGLITYVKLSIRNFFSIKYYPFIIDTNHTSIKAEAFFISIANSNQFGNNFTIAPKASLKDGLLDIVIVKKMNKFRLVFSILKQICIGKLASPEEKNFDQKYIQYFQTKQLGIKNPSLAPLHIDGDPVKSAPEFKIKIIENAFRLIQP